MSCEHTLGLVHEYEDYSYLFKLKKELNENDIEPLEEIKEFSYCPDCGIYLKGMLQKRLQTLKQMKEDRLERERLEKELKEKKLEEDIKQALLRLGFCSSSKKEEGYYFIVDRGMYTNYIYWTLYSLGSSIVKDKLKVKDIKIYKKPSIEYIESVLLNNGYEKDTTKFWYSYRKDNRGVTLYNYDIFTGVLDSDCYGDSVNDFSYRYQLYYHNKDEIKRYLGVDIELECIEDRSSL